MGRSGPRYTKKTQVLIAVEREKVGLGRVRLAVIDTADKAEEQFRFIQQNIANGTHIVTDGDASYAVICRKLQFTHTAYNLSAAGASPAHIMLPAVHQVASLFKRWIAGTLHHGQAPDHLQFYCDEYTFRFNRRRSRSRGLLWYRLVEQAVVTAPQPTKAMRVALSDEERERRNGVKAARAWERQQGSLSL